MCPNVGNLWYGIETFNTIEASLAFGMEVSNVSNNKNSRSQHTFKNYRWPLDFCQKEIMSNQVFSGRQKHIQQKKQI